jgi:hypothetical protein
MRQVVNFVLHSFYALGKNQWYLWKWGLGGSQSQCRLGKERRKVSLIRVEP